MKGPREVGSMRIITVTGLACLSLLASAVATVPAQAASSVPATATYTDASGNTVTLNDSTVLLDAESLGLIGRISDERITFTSTRFPQSDRIRPGAVIIASQSLDVRMLYVESVAAGSGALVVKGRPATLAEAYADLRIQKVVRFDEPPQARSDSVTITSSSMVTPRSDATWSYRFAGTSVEDPDSGDEAEVGLFLSGSFTLQPEIDVDIDLRGSRFEFAVEAQPSVTLSAEAKASFDVSAPLRLAELDFQRKVFFIGPVPVELHPQLSLDVTVKASAEAGLSARIIDYSQKVRVGVGYVDGTLRNTSDPINPFDGFGRPSLTGSVSAEGSITLSAELFVNLYEFAGPTVRIELVGTLHVEPLEPKWAWLEADVNILVGGRVAIFGSEGGPDFEFDVAPGLGPWEVWTARTRDPGTVKGVIGFSKRTTRIGVVGVQCVDVVTSGVAATAVKWRLPQAAVAAGLKLGTSETGAPVGSEVTGTRACIFSGSQDIRTYVEVLQGSSSTGVRHSVEVSSEIINPPRLPEKVAATAQYEGAEITWTAAKSPSYWTVTATTKDRKAPAARRSITQTATGSARSIRLKGLASRVDYVVTVHGTNDGGVGPKASAKVRPLGRILLVGAPARLGAWADGVGTDAATTTDATTSGLMLLSTGTSALALVPAARLKQGATGIGFARLRMKDGAVEWYAKKPDGTPLNFWQGRNSNLALAERTFIANPAGTSIVLFQCVETGWRSCSGHFVRVQPKTNRITKLPDSFQTGLGALVSEGSSTASDWAMSADGRFIVSGIGQQVTLWDLDRGSQVSSTWNAQACGEGRCGGSVHSVGIASGNRVLVSSLNTSSTGLCLNSGDLWEWTPTTGKRRIISPTQPTWAPGPGSSQRCEGASKFILPVGAASAARATFYEVDGRLRIRAWLLDLPSGRSWRPYTWPIGQTITMGLHEIAEVPKKLTINSDGTVIAAPVYVPVEEGVFGGIFDALLLGAHVCHFTARACTLAIGSASDPAVNYLHAAFFGGVQLSGRGDRVTFLGYNRTLNRITWWRQDLNPKLN